ncbi:Outer membrane efflux protein [Candidatus Magnetomorum sp. HK-1]|nr:Outer membrane efflux protein [Candidatus Magnetomorum sp. HK-1]
MRKLFIWLLNYCIIATLFLSVVYCEDKSLSIRDVVKLAIENNLQLKVDHVSKDIQKEKYNAVSTIFDPRFKASASLANTSNKTDKNIFRSDIEKMDASVSKKIQNGDTLLVNLASKRQKTKPFLPGTPTSKTQFSHNLSFSYIKPMLNGRGKDIATTDIQIEENNLKLEKLLLEQDLINTISIAQNYYWELYKSKEQHQAKIKSFELAQQFLKTTQEKLDMGLLADNALLQAKAEVAAREEAVLIAENAVKNNQDRLVQYIYGNVKEADNSPLVLAQKPLFEKFKSINIDTEIQKALDYRIDYQVGKIRIENADIYCNYYKNQTLPKLDLSLTLSLEGDGKSNNIANENFFSGDNYSGLIAISGEYPWKKRRDKANLSKAKYQRYQAQLSLEKIQQALVIDVRKSLRNVLSLEKRFESTKAALLLAEEKLKMEEDRFKAGYSTSYNILQFQRDLSDSMVKNINACVDYQIAKVSLEKSTGMTLEVHQVEIK